MTFFTRCTKWISLLAFQTTLFLVAQLNAQGFYKDIFVDAGVGLSSFSNLPAVTFLTLSSEFILTDNQTEQNLLMVENQYDVNGALLYPDGEPRFKVIYTNGGSSVTHGNSLGAAGRERIREFYENGGSYTGSCAGSAIFSRGRDGNTEEPSYYKLWPGFVQRVTVGPLSVGLNIPDNSPLLNYFSYGDDYYIDNVHFNYGNYANENISFPAETEVLLYYDIPTQAMHSHIACWAYKKSEITGRGVVIGCHPEGYATGERLELMSAILSYALDGIGSPTLKGNLEKGNTRTMDKDWTDNDPAFAKIGDRQYHHFKINVDGTAENFTVTLNGANGYNFNLYVRKDDFVTENGYDYSDILNGSDKILTIHEATTGDWYIAVELAESVEAEYTATQYDYVSNLQVLNGIPYTITVDWEGNATGIINETDIPQQFTLEQNYPNPFNPSTTIRYELPIDGFVRLDIYDIRGRLITTLVQKEQSAGIHHAYWNGTNLNGNKCSSGIYIYQLIAGHNRYQKQMVLIK